MHQPIKVDSRFATAHDTARILGVPKARMEELIRRVKRLTDRVIERRSKAAETVNTGASKKKIGRTAAKKGIGRHAGTGSNKTKAKAAKSARS
jgi:hypothetical protein